MPPTSLVVCFAPLTAQPATTIPAARTLFAESAALAVIS